MRWLALVAALLVCPSLAWGQSVIRRIGYTDTFVSDNGDGTESRTRRLGNYLNYQSGGVWSETVNTMVAGSDPGDLDDGSFVYGEQSAQAPVQCYLKNSDDAQNQTRIHCRKSAKPKQWYTIQAAKTGPNFVNDVVPTVTRGERKIVYANLWSTGGPAARKANLIWYTKRDGLRKVIRIKGELAPTSYQFRLKLPPDWDFIIRPNGDGIIRNGADQKRFRLVRPYAWDSSGGGTALGGTPEDNWYGAQYVIDNVTSQGSNPVYIFSVELTESIAGATFPVFLDPSSNLDETTFQDGYLYETIGSRNFGGSNNGLTTGFNSSSALRRSIIKLDDPTTDLPAGTYSSFTLTIYVDTWAAWTVSPVTCEFRIIANADADLVVGTANNADQTGSMCWDSKAYDAGSPTAWGGGAGNPSLVADGSPPTFAYNEAAPGYRTATLDNSTGEGFQDGTYTSGALLIKSQAEATVGASPYLQSEEDAATPAYFDVTYTAPVASTFPTGMAHPE